jgi:hypothetical protein
LFSRTARIAISYAPYALRSRICCEPSSAVNVMGGGDVLCIPGGLGCIPAIENERFLSAIRRIADKARYVTSVCTGSLILGAAGLLHGRRAACHWAWRDMLTAFGATPDDGRVVRDGNIITGGGVTAGVDFALLLIAELWGTDAAQSVQLLLEYAPAPPFDAAGYRVLRPQPRGIARSTPAPPRPAARLSVGNSYITSSGDRWHGGRATGGSPSMRRSIHAPGRQRSPAGPFSRGGCQAEFSGARASGRAPPSLQLKPRKTLSS